jgi:hypothetical protein
VVLVIAMRVNTVVAVVAVNTVAVAVNTVVAVAVAVTWKPTVP